MTCTALHNSMIVRNKYASSFFNVLTLDGYQSTTTITHIAIGKKEIKGLLILKKQQHSIEVTAYGTYMCTVQKCHGCWMSWRVQHHMVYKAASHSHISNRQACHQRAPNTSEECVNFAPLRRGESGPVSLPEPKSGWIWEGGEPERWQCF